MSRRRPGTRGLSVSWPLHLNTNRALAGCGAARKDQPLLARASRSPAAPTPELPGPSTPPSGPPPRAPLRPPGRSLRGSAAPGAREAWRCRACGAESHSPGSGSRNGVVLREAASTARQRPDGLGAGTSGRERRSGSRTGSRTGRRASPTRWGRRVPVPAGLSVGVRVRVRVRVRGERGCRSAPVWSFRPDRGRRLP